MLTRILLWIVAILTLVVISGCTGIKYDRTWQNTGYPWPVPQTIQVVIADVNTVDVECRKLGVRTLPGYVVQGCYDSKTQTLYSISDIGILLHEWEHVWNGYVHP